MEKRGVIPIKLEGGGFLASVGYESVFATAKKRQKDPGQVSCSTRAAGKYGHILTRHIKCSDEERGKNYFFNLHTTKKSEIRNKSWYKNWKSVKLDRSCKSG